MKRIGKYIIRGLLGKGGMGRIYKVEAPVILKISALKLLEPAEVLLDIMGYEQLKSMFITEAVTMAAIRHPNVVSILDFDEYKGKPFYVMDYFSNNLGDMIGESYILEKPTRIIRTDKAIQYTRQILEGLSCLHYSGIIHRDIKPFNILVTERDMVKICDFGLSKLHGETYSGPPNLNVGSPFYAAPEQETNPDSVEYSADTYSTGILLYRMLTGKLPLSQPGENNIVLPSTLNADLDEEWDAFILKATANRRERRFQSADEMKRCLKDLGDKWEEKVRSTCSLVDIESTQRKRKQKDVRTVEMRKIPIKIRPSKAKKLFQLDDYWRPRSYLSNFYRIDGQGTITDNSTNLVWQQSGSDYPMNWNKAAEYAAALKKDHFQGHSKWRLPTIDELVSLLTKTPHGSDHCIEPVFDLKQKWLWSCDRRSFTAAWYVSIDMGYVSWQDFSAQYYVRCVCNKEA